MQVSHSLVKPKTLFWTLSKLGKFSSKSAYHVSQASRFTVSFNWNLLWNSKLHNRQKLLFWRILSDTIPCKARLKVIFHMSNLNCFICNSSMENSTHIFIHCPLVQHAFFISKWNFHVNAFAHLNVSNNLFASSLIRTEFIVFVASLFDLVWLNRNKVAQGSSSFSVQDLVSELLNVLLITGRAYAYP